MQWPAPVTRFTVIIELDDGTYLVVDVKPPPCSTSRRSLRCLSWTARMCAGKGWGFEVRSGADPTLLRNIRFLGGGRHGQRRVAGG